MNTYRVRVETYDGCVTIWYEKSKAKNACEIINNRTFSRLCGLNIKQVSVTPTPTPLSLSELKKINLTPVRP